MYTLLEVSPSCLIHLQNVKEDTLEKNAVVLYNAESVFGKMNIAVSAVHFRDACNQCASPGVPSGVRHRDGVHDEERCAARVWNGESVLQLRLLHQNVMFSITSVGLKMQQLGFVFRLNSSLTMSLERSRGPTRGTHNCSGANLLCTTCPMWRAMWYFTLENLCSFFFPRSGC